VKYQTIDPAGNPTAVFYKRCTVDLRSGEIVIADVPCRNLEDVLGGFGRSFQDLMRSQKILTPLAR
jgi:aldehyde:ferredoxin oxidoreductase